jgi:hypothetical protein
MTCQVTMFATPYSLVITAMKCVPKHDASAFESSQCASSAEKEYHLTSGTLCIMTGAARRVTCDLEPRAYATLMRHGGRVFVPSILEFSTVHWRSEAPRYHVLSEQLVVTLNMRHKLSLVLHRSRFNSHAVLHNAVDVNVLAIQQPLSS